MLCYVVYGVLFLYVYDIDISCVWTCTIGGIRRYSHGAKRNTISSKRLIIYHWMLYKLWILISCHEPFRSNRFMLSFIWFLIFATDCSAHSCLHVVYELCIYYHISDKDRMRRIKAFIIIITVMYHNSFKPEYMVMFAYITIQKY